jgi:hypothetical protein
MTMIFTTIGSAADYGTFGRWLLIVTWICWSSQFAEMSLMGTPFTLVCSVMCCPTFLKAPSLWSLSMALYMIGFITYGTTLVFYAALLVTHHMLANFVIDTKLEISRERSLKSRKV